MEVGDIVRGAGGILLLAWLPGWTWSRVLLPDAGRIARVATSVGLSIALLTLALYLGNLGLGIRITAAHAVLWSLVIALAGFAAGAFRKKTSPA